MYKYSNIDLKHKQNTTKNNNNKLIQIQIKSKNVITCLLALLKESLPLILLILSVSLSNISLLSQFCFTQDEG